ncbi:MAG: hypothetical protein GF307_05605 [candidate division Zixibacteria bacterium]|nr:hypothetical protein [candidate division Zixibacteria bacterium]
MFRTIDDFKLVWGIESEKSKKMIDALDDNCLSQKVSEGHRNIARLAWHIACTIPEMAARTGLKLDGPEYESPVPESLREIKDAYYTASDSLLKQVGENWDDEALLTEDDMYGEMWPRYKSLYIILVHEIHHRGQMTVLMRQAGLKVPGIYGPSKEEWAASGIPEPGV